jgi:uncharacterized protein with PQ loop repeat
VRRPHSHSHDYSKTLSRVSPLFDGIIAESPIEESIEKETEKPTAAAALSNFLGYAIGIGSLSLYSPLIYTILKRKSAQGFAMQTWVFNLIGNSLACAYPYQKGYAFSTYAELLVLSIQAVGILGLLCYFNGYMAQYVVGISVYAICAVYVATRKLPEKLINGMQAVSSLCTNYANVPQIILSFTTKSCSWSPFTSGAGTLGNLIRIFTTMNLAGGDPLFIFGYILGGSTNAVLMTLGIMYPPAKALPVV